MASDTQIRLQKDLAITPKTASLFISLGFTDYKDLHSYSPNKLVALLRGLPGITAKQAETYRRATRRVVWLSTQSDPQPKAKTYQDWTQKGLMKRGVWEDTWDDLTGDEAAARFK